MRPSCGLEVALGRKCGAETIQCRDRIPSSAHLEGHVFAVYWYWVLLGVEEADREVASWCLCVWLSYQLSLLWTCDSCAISCCLCCDRCCRTHSDDHTVYLHLETM